MFHATSNKPARFYLYMSWDPFLCRPFYYSLYVPFHKTMIVVQVLREEDAAVVFHKNPVLLSLQNPPYQWEDSIKPLPGLYWNTQDILPFQISLLLTSVLQEQLYGLPPILHNCDSLGINIPFFCMSAQITYRLLYLYYRLREKPSRTGTI